MLTHDLSGHEPDKTGHIRKESTPEEKEAHRKKLQKNHHREECIVCFEKECRCKPRS